MKRLKSFALAATVLGAVLTLIRNRWSESSPVDPGGWEPVDPN